MAQKFVLEGWIRAKLDYPISLSYTHEFYFDNHSRFDFRDEEAKSERIKFSNFINDRENVVLKIIFGYDQIGVQFTIIIKMEEIEDRISIFETALSKAIETYRDFKKNFLSTVCPEEGKGFEFVWERLLLNPVYGFFEGMRSKQKNDFLKEIANLLRNYTSDIRFVLVKKGSKKYNGKRVVRALTGSQITDLSRFEFDSIFVICDEIYLFVSHHLFSRYYFFEDPSIGITTAAKWGFICSLTLLDLHYEIKDFYKAIREEENSLMQIHKKWIPVGLDLRRERLIGLKNRQLNIEDNLREFINLSEKLYDGLKESEFSSTKLWDALTGMESLPHSLFEAFGLLEYRKLGGLTNMRKDIERLTSNLEMLEIKLNRRQIYVISFVLIIVFSAFHFSRIETGYIADILQILTFVVAIIILLIRIWPKYKQR